jgi:hypothetical protein
MSPMNAPQHSTSEQPLPRGANRAAQPLHVRQREMVLASLFARPAAKPTNHRRWA